MKPSFIPSSCCDGEILAGDIDGARYHALRQREADRVEIGDDDVAGTDLLRDGGGHAADGAAPVMTSRR